MLNIKDRLPNFHFFNQQSQHFWKQQGLDTFFLSNAKSML